MKSVVLLSGGLDSVVLTHYVAKDMQEEVYPIFFSYGQPQAQPELEAANLCAKQLRDQGFPVDGVEIVELTEALNHENFDNEYVEQRNLIFISHAARYAELIGAEKIYIGVIDNENPNGRYNDTTQTFVYNCNHVLNMSNIKLVAPFVNKNKKDIFWRSRYYGIKLFDTWSCMHPVKQKDGSLAPCGECGNCKLLQSLYFPIQAWYDCDFTPEEPFIKAFKADKITEIRLAINNKCNQSCAHCFYGFKETKKPELSFEEMKSVLEDAFKAGIEQIHFSGKEPFYDEAIFDYVDWLKEFHPEIKYDVVTNGVNIEKYLDRIIESGFYRVCVSFDDFDGGITRDKSTADAMKLLTDRGQHVAAFMCLTKENMEQFIPNMLKLRGEYGVKEFCPVPLHCSGNGKNLVDQVLSPEEMYLMYTRFKYLTIDARIDGTFRGSYIEALMNKDLYPDFVKDVLETAKYADYQMSNSYYFLPELFCNSYDFNVTLLSDGYLLGCALEVTDKYDKLAVGNVKETPFAELLAKGKDLAIERMKKVMKCSENNKCDFCAGECFHNKYCYKYSSLKS